MGTGEALLGPGPAGAGSELPITGDPGKRQAAERESEGVVVVTTGGTTQPGPSEGPLLHRCTSRKGGTLMSADKSARSISQADGLDPFEPFNACCTAVPSRTQSVVSMPFTTSSPAAM